MSEVITYTRTAALAAIADRIRQRVKSATTDIIAIGKDLIGAKAQLPHGAFLPWLDAEFGWTDRTARNYIRAADLAGSKSETISVLPPSTVYLLAAPSTPEKIRTDIIQEIETGKPVDHRNVETRIREARRSERNTKKSPAKVIQPSTASAPHDLANLRRDPTPEEGGHADVVRMFSAYIVMSVHDRPEHFKKTATYRVVLDALEHARNRFLNGEVGVDE